MRGIDRPATIRADSVAAVVAGVIAGVIFLGLFMLSPLLIEGTPWGATWLVAGIVPGVAAGTPWAPFDVWVFLLALVVDLTLSIFYALLLALVIHRMSLVPALLTGVLYGLLIYLLNFYYITEWYPGFVLLRNWLTVFAHVAWGIGAAWAYKGLEATAPVTAPAAA